MRFPPYGLLYRWILPLLVTLCIGTSIHFPRAQAFDIDFLLKNPEKVDPFTVNVPEMREALFDKLNQQEMNIIQRHVQETGVPWYDPAGEVYTHHPRYKQATKEFAQVWKQHMEQGRKLDLMLRQRGMNQVLNRAKELARNDDVNIRWNKEFRSSGTDPWKGRGPYTDIEYTGSDRANKYVLKALKEKGLHASITPGQNNIKVKTWDLDLWGEEGPGKIHWAFEADNREFAKSASPLKQKILFDK
ncbi:MAG: hypothetical protein JRI80_16890, partial [Deltaproteobacteria bacterium]|nr:hypothetical protein [Deltaproteobacteria bacterium]